MREITLRHRSDCVESHCVRIALGLKELDHRTVAMPRSRARSIVDPDDAAVSPRLLIDGAEAVRALPIIEFLEEVEGGRPLLPGAAVERARVRAIAQTCATVFAPAACADVGGHAAWLMASGGAGRLDWIRTFLRRGFACVEALLSDGGAGRYCHGDEPGMADCMLIPHVALARHVGAPLLTFPHVAAINLVCSSDIAFAAAAAETVHDSATRA